MLTLESEPFSQHGCGRRGQALHEVEEIFNQLGEDIGEHLQTTHFIPWPLSMPACGGLFSNRKLFRNSRSTWKCHLSFNSPNLEDISKQVTVYPQSRNAH